MREAQPSDEVENNGNDSELLRVAIIGAGSAGMTATKQILETAAKSASKVDVVVFERRGNVGGIWQYDEDVKSGYLAWESEQATLQPVEEGGGQRKSRLRYGWENKWPPGAMFDGLRTNIPSDLMAYRDAPFAPDTNLFPSRKTVQQYLEGYAKRHNLLSCIRFNTIVTILKKTDHSKQWLIKTKSSLNDPSISTSKEDGYESFSHVIVCHGRCNTPNIPNISGLETFKGRVLHSAWYRDPSKIMERDILVVGNASSGMDIARELSGYITRDLPSGLSPNQWKEKCKKDPFNVYSSWHSLEKPPPMDFSPLDPDSPDWCRKIKVLDQILQINGNDIHFKDGTVFHDIKLLIFETMG